MKYNAKYDRWVTKGGLVYRYSKRQDKLVMCKLQKLARGYLQVNVSKPKAAMVYVHRLVYETFNGEIPDGMEIDHINTVRDDNSLENLRCVTPVENHRNPLTRKHMSESISERMKGKTYSGFGIKFKEHFGIARYENEKLYDKECNWYIRHNHKCRWE